MADISRITLPSGNTYDIKDAVAREMIAGGVSFNIVWTAANYASTSAPTAAVRGRIPEGVVVYYNSGASSTTGTLVASTDTKGQFYLIYSKSQAGNLDMFDEYVTVESESGLVWEKIGDTLIDLSNVVTGVTLNKQTDTVLGEATTFTNAASAVTFSGGTSDVALGEATTFKLTSGTVTHGALTGHTDAALGADTTFAVTQPTITVTPSTTYLGASASGTAVGANGTAAAVTGYADTSTDTFVKSVSAETNKKLVTTSIVPTNGTETVSKVTKTASKLVTTSIPNVTGNTSVSIPNVTGNTNVSIPNVTSAGSASTWSFTMGTGDNAETLIIGGGNSVAPTLGTALSASKVTLGTNLTATNTTLGTAITAATGAVSSTGSGSDIVTAVTVSDKTVAKAGSAVTVATGATAANGTGDAIVTGVTIGQSASAITSLGDPTTATVLTGVKVTAQPSITLAANTASATGRVQVATGISSASATNIAVTPNDDDAVAAIVSMPTSSVGTGITVGTNDKVTAVTSIGTATAAAQTITVGTNDKVGVLKDTTSLDVTKGS